MAFLLPRDGFCRKQISSSAARAIWPCSAKHRRRLCNGRRRSRAASPKSWRGAGTPVCVLASGDPFYYGVGPTLAGHISPDEMICLPVPSSLSLASARLGWPLQDCDVISLHGRTFERIIPHLRPNARLLVLSWDAATPEKLARLLTARGLGGSRLVVLEALGRPERAPSRKHCRCFQAA